MFSVTAAFTQRRIFLFFLPLAASWLLMSAEGPILQAAIARLPEMQTQLAAFGIVMSLEIAIESPVIMLLATSTALATNAKNYLVLRRFVIGLNLLVTVVAALMAFSPLYRFVVRDLMGIPVHIAAAALPGMRIMLFWSAAIGIRRFKQGVLIQHKQTRWVGFGTIARLLSSGGTGILLAVFTSLSGVCIASTGLMAGVTIEAFFILIAARPTIRGILAGKIGVSRENVTLLDVARFHAPLAATSLLTLLAQPLIGAGLARMPFPVENLAAWPVIWGILFIFRSPALALPEVVIALISERPLKAAVRGFSHRVGILSSLALAMLIATPLLNLYLRYIAGLPQAFSRFVMPGIMLALAIPYLNSVHSWFRGLLMSARLTRIIYWGMGINLGSMCLLVVSGVVLKFPGAATAVVALTLSFGAELIFLCRMLQKNAQLV